MKEIFRKPFILLLMATVLFSGIALTSLLAYNMGKNREIVDKMYSETTVKFRVLPGTGSTAKLELPLPMAESIANLDQVNSTYCELQCPAVIASDSQFITFPTAHGTSNITKFAESRKITITWGEGNNEESFVESNAFCILEEGLASSLGLQAGDKIGISGCIIEYVMEEAAPVFTLTIAGTYVSDELWPLENAIILSDRLFYGEENLIYSRDMASRYQLYRDFEVTIDSAYNREYKQVQEDIRSVLGDSRNYIIYSNSRVLERTVQPLEQRLDAQEALHTLLWVTIVFGCTLLVMLLTLKRRSPILIRMVLGEKYWAVCVMEWWFVLLCIVVSMLPSMLLLLGLAVLDVPTWNSFVTLATFLIISAPTALMTIIIPNTGGLVKLYQARNRNE